MKTSQTFDPLSFLKPGAKSVCHCGHTGDGLKSQHADRLAAGHGACKVPGCKCEAFTWKAFIVGSD